MLLAKSIAAFAAAASLATAAPAFAGPQGSDTTYGGLAGAAAGGLATHSIGGAVIGGVGGALIGNAIGRHNAHRYRRRHYYYSHRRY